MANRRLNTQHTMTLFQQTRANRKAQARTTPNITIRPRATYWVCLLLAGLALPTTASRAQTKPSAEAGGSGYVGIGVNFAPRYQGSDESRTSGIPGFEYHWANGMFVGGTDGLVGVQLNATPQLHLGLALGLDEGRKESDSRYLTGMGDVVDHGTFNLFAKVAVNDQLGLSTGLQLGTGNSGKGGLLNVGASYGVSLAPATRLSFNVGATLANSEYMQDYFGVSAAQASATGYKRYIPDSGVRDVTVDIGLQHQITREWMLFTTIKSTTLSNAAKESPLVRKATSQSAYAGVAWSF